MVDVVADPRHDLARSEDGVALAQLSTWLDDREREVIRLRFQEDLIQREIAERVGCSQMRVSRILRDALAQMREAAGTTGVAFDR
jgi:RNA polymerase sigma-B factor